jgi:hypothetical protein
MSRFRRTTVFPAAALAPLAIATIAFAQTPPATGEDAGDLAEVIVTGTRLTAEASFSPRRRRC